MIWKILQYRLIIIWIICLFLKLNQIGAVRFALPIEEATSSMCPGDHTKCSDGSNHFLCEESVLIENCTKYNGYSAIQMTDGIRKEFTEGHNGIRNKVADDFQIGNMNLIYWSPELELVAKKYLMQCRRQHDPCKFIGLNQLPVNTNVLSRTKKYLIDRWPSRTVRQWYLELGAKIQTREDFIKARKNNQNFAGNFSQMIWPKTEFVGCNAANMFDGFYQICYYFPPFKPGSLEKVLFDAPPCTKCPRARPSCSDTFAGLCGMDVEMNDSSALEKEKILYFIIFVIFWVS